ncbi:hypothetical protein AVEN_148936-1 [Araneus ventricosus]|uniref:Uncharacterized protein n=1 Tax=Araneus ventricosus TaxID=182803 RepID=A0A4Y2FPW1_ARAVE|nr:hypothetical protein AVEN_148936-1 [Araneus ventricosus]
MDEQPLVVSGSEFGGMRDDKDSDEVIQSTEAKRRGFQNCGETRELEQASIFRAHGPIAALGRRSGVVLKFEKKGVGAQVSSSTSDHGLTSGTSLQAKDGDRPDITVIFPPPFVKWD